MTPTSPPSIVLHNNGEQIAIYASIRGSAQYRSTHRKSTVTGSLAYICASIRQTRSYSSRPETSRTFLLLGSNRMRSPPLRWPPNASQSPASPLSAQESPPEATGPEHLRVSASQVPRLFPVVGQGYDVLRTYSDDSGPRGSTSVYTVERVAYMLATYLPMSPVSQYQRASARPV